MAPLIEARNLTKTYEKGGTVKALRNVSLAVEEGELYALLGLNGAGKTTLIRIMLGLSRQSSGSRMLLGGRVEEGGWRGKVGFLPEVFSVASGMTARRVLEFLGRLDGFRKGDLARRVERVLTLLELNGVADRDASSFSKGMTRRLGIAQALLADPRAIFLDEPTEGLDPIATIKMRGCLEALKRQGVAILMTSHLLSEVERVADRVGFLQKGSLIAEGSVTALTSSGGPRLEDVFADILGRSEHA